MHTLTIKDLPITEALDTRAMASVRGGTSKYKGPSLLAYRSDYDSSKHHFGLDATQDLFQGQDFSTSTGNNVALSDGRNKVNVDGRQTGKNVISF